MGGGRRYKRRRKLEAENDKDRDMDRDYEQVETEETRAMEALTGQAQTGWEDDDDPDIPPPDLDIHMGAHSSCHKCVYKAQYAVQSLPGVVSSDLSPNKTSLTVYTIKDLHEDGLRQLVLGDSGLSIDVETNYGNCAHAREALEEVKSKFDENQFKDFFKSFQGDVEKYSEGSWGNSYRRALSSVVRVVVGYPGETEIITSGCGFVVSKDSQSTLIMTCKSLIVVGEGLHIRVVTFDFHILEASLIYVAEDYDFAILMIHAEITKSLIPLQISSDSINISQPVFTIATPSHKMLVPRKMEEDPRTSLLINTIWFPLCIGYVAQPNVVGVHPSNLRGNFLFFHAQGCDADSFGSPVINDSLRVIGIFVATRINDDGAAVGSWALNVNSIRVPEGSLGELLGSLMNQFQTKKKKNKNKHSKV